MSEKRVPKLRFKEFSDEWEEKKLGEIASFCGGGTPSKEILDYWHGLIPWISSADIIENNISNIKISRFITEKAVNESATKLCYPNTIHIVSRVGVGKVALSKQMICTSQDFINITHIEANIIFSTYLILIKMQRISIQTQGTSIKGITNNEVKRFILNFPSLPEQQKIADFLSSVDERIELLEDKLTRLKNAKKGYMQKIFNQEIRFKDENGNDYPEWEEKKLGEVLKERKERNTGNLSVCSVAVKKGVINQIEHLGRSFAAKNTENYKLVKYGDVIYTKSPTGSFPYGIIKQSFIREDVVVSPLYVVCEPLNINIGYLLHNYFSLTENAYNYLNPIIQKGAKNTININTQTYLSNKIYLPISEKEQQKIADFLSTFDKQIDLTQEKLNHLKEVKKGLLQQMFV